MRSKNHVRLVQVASVSAFTYMLTIFCLSTTVPLNGRNVAQISDHYFNLFAPPGLTFMIWSLILLLLVIYTVRLQMRLNRLPAEAQPRLIRQGWLFALTCLLNGSWLLTWHLEQMRLTMGLMMLLLVILLMLYLDIPLDLPLRKRWLNRLPFSLYLGWISVTAMANATILLVSMNWSAFGLLPQVWTLLLFSAIVLLGWIFLIRFRDIGFALVLVLALAGILYRHVILLEGEFPAIIYGAWAAIGLLAAGMLLALCHAFKLKPVTEPDDQASSVISA